MGVLIDKEDFVGHFSIPQSSYNELSAFIDLYEKDYLIQLLGADLYTAFVADLTAQVPQAAKYTYIFAPFYRDHCFRAVISKGMKNMLLGFIFFDYMRQIKYKATESGMVYTNPDTSAAVHAGSLYKYLNDAVDTYNAIQYYMSVIQPSDYPEYNGQSKGYTNPVLQ